MDESSERVNETFRAWNPRRTRATVAALVVLAAALSALHTRAYREINYVDELQHIDYMIKAGRGEMVRRGDVDGQEALREEACRGIDIGPEDFRANYQQEKALPPCDAPHLDPLRFPERGVNTAYLHPPTYYAVTGVVARAIRAMTGANIVTAARLLGIVWLGLAVALLWALMIENGVSPPAAVPLSVLFSAAPAMLISTGTVNPDATLPAAGAALLLTVQRWERGASPTWLPAVIAAASTAMKVSNAVTVGFLVVYLLWRARRSEDQRPPRRRMAAVLVAAAVIPAVAWLVTENAIARVPSLAVPLNSRLHVDVIPAEDLAASVPALVTPLRSVQAAPFLQRPGRSAIVFGTEWLLVGAAVAAAALGVRGSRWESLGGGALLALVTAGPALVVMNFFVLRLAFPIPGRFGLGVVPALFVAAGPLGEKLGGRIAISTLAGVTLVQVVFASIAG